MKVFAVILLLAVAAAYAYELSPELAYDGLLQDNESSAIFRVSEVEKTSGTGPSCGEPKISTDLACIAKCQTRNHPSGLCRGNVCSCID